jgi:hypothetical protein
LQRDDEEAAKVYEEFVKDFGGADNEDSGNKAFVSGGVIQPGQQNSNRSNAKPVDKRQQYVPPLAPQPPRGAIKKVSVEFADGEEDEDDKADGELAFKPPLSHRGKPRRMDVLLENMKK